MNEFARWSILFVCILLFGALVEHDLNATRALSGSGVLSQEMTIDYNDYLQSTKEQDRETE